jgi:hypothetical protein
MSKNQEWKAEVFYNFKDRPEDICRSLARDLGVAWATLWDFKQSIINGGVTEENFLSKPKILLLDIETAPLLVHNWSLWQNYTSLNQIVDDWFMLSWAAKWIDEEEVFFDSLISHKKAFKEDPQNDIIIVKSLYSMIDEADIIIGHNLKKFDDKKAKARFLKHGFIMPTAYRKIDTLDIVKREFAITSNKLDFLATYLGLSNKVAHEGHTLWVKCMKGDLEAWKVMKEYNIHDVVLLEEVYKLIRGWSTNHPNLASYYNDFVERCTNCASTNLINLEEKAFTNLGSYETIRCGDCGKISKKRGNLFSEEKRSTLLGNIT